MDQLESLKCSQCGAPLPAVQSEMVTCPYCGVTQQRIDAEKYVQQLSVEVYSWVRSMMPSGTQTISQVDPLARSQIFENLVKPNLEQRNLFLNIYFTKLGSLCLFVPPFARPSKLLAEMSKLSPKSFLEDASRYRGLSQLAQSDEQSAFISTIAAKCEAVGFLCNVASIFSNQLRSYEQVARNFVKAAESLADIENYRGVASRIKALASLSRAIMLLQKGVIKDAFEELNSAKKAQNESSSILASSTSMLAWLAGLQSEIIMLESVRLIADGISAASFFGLDYREAVAKLETYTKAYEEMNNKPNQLYNSIKPDTYHFMANSFREIYGAKAGMSFSPAILGNGLYWAYCWLVELNYTFETGILFMKKGIPIRERFLLPAQFQLYSKEFYSLPHHFVLDIFSIRAPSKFWERVSGKETSLTTGFGYQYLSQLRNERIPPSSYIIPPFCTRTEADKAANFYLDSVRVALGGKLKLSIATISQPVLVGGTIVNGKLIIPGIPEYICPYVGEESALKSLCF